MVNRMHARRKTQRGAVLVETAAALPVFLLLVLGTLDLGLAVARYNATAEAARTGTRLAIVHGSDAPPRMQAWNAALAATSIKSHVEPLMAGCGVPADEFTVQVVYPTNAEGDDLNQPGQWVEVIVTTDYTPLMTAYFGSDPISMRSRSRMIIAN
jgi:Flp pilus assembly protein TadG